MASPSSWSVASASSSSRRASANPTWTRTQSPGAISGVNATLDRAAHAAEVDLRLAVGEPLEHLPGDA